MKKVFGIFKQKWFLTLIGIIAISLIIFFLGDVLRIGNFRPFGSIQSRYIAIGSLTGGYILYYAWYWFKGRKKNQQMVNTLVANASASSDEDASKEEVQVLSDKLQDALQTLGTIQKKNGGKQNLYQLPWFVIIGPPGAGKTTLLANSDLNFPLSEKYGKDAVRGVGGTRNCDWWFTDEAILLDTAGRFATQDSNEAVDKAAWQGFLDLLRKNRAHQPVNGIIIAVSIADILQLSAEQQEAYALTIRKRVQELHEHLGIRFPVYMIFTKCDLLSGFSEFYDDIDSEGRNQVWGMTFPLEEGEQSPVGLFDAEFGLLEERIYQQLVDKLEKERSLERRQALYLFPQQFSSLQETLSGFLDKLYHASRYNETAMLRGIYFTSATQEGTPIDRIMSSLASNYGVSPQQTGRFSDKGKSFFINNLLQNVIFTESGLAGTNLKLKRKLQWLQTALAAVAVLLAVGVSSLLLISYFNNSAYVAGYEEKVARIDERIAALPDENENLQPYLKVLEDVRQLSFSYVDEPVDIPLMSRLGLSQAAALGSKMDSKYEDLLLKTIRPYAKSLLEENIRQNMGENPESIFGALKTYLFLGGEVPEGKIVSVKGIDWNNNAETGDGYDRAVDRHFNNLVRKPDKYIKLDKQLVTDARIALEKIDPSKLAYVSYRDSIVEEASQYNFDVLQKDDLDQISKSFVRKSSLPWSDGIPGIFTKKGYENVYLPGQVGAAKSLSEDAWVLGNNRSLSNVDNANKLIFDHYQEEYVQRWSAFLEDIEAQPINSREEAKQVYLSLTANGGNLLFRLIQEVKNETQFSEEEKEGEDESVKIELPVPKKVERYFSRFSDWDEESEFQKISQLFDEIYKYFSQDNIFEKVKDNELKNVLDSLGGEAEKLPGSLGEMVRSLVEPSEKMVTGVLKNKEVELFQLALQEQVGDFCNTKIVGRFPLKKNTKKIVALADFTKFFQSGGILDAFEQQYLKDVTLDSTVVSNVRKSFEAGKRIRDKFFSTGAFQITYGLQLISVHPNIAAIELSIGAGSGRFEVGKINKRIFNWPSSELVTAIIELKEPPLDKFEAAIYQGDAWGIFKLIENDQLPLKNFSGTVFRVFSPTPSHFKFVETELRKFKCPVL